MGFGYNFAYKKPVIESESTDISLTLKNNEVCIYDNSEISSLQILLPSVFEAGFISCVTFLYNSDTVNFDIPNIEYIGIDCVDGVFVPTVVGRSYDMIYDYNGIDRKCYVG